MAEEINVEEVFVYTEGAVVPHDVVRVRVHPSVTIISEKAFYKREKIEEVQLSEGLLEIGKKAFAYCSAVKRLSIPSTVTVIHPYTFYNCENLEELELCDGLQEINEYAFFSCFALKRLIIPDTVRIIGGLAFCHSYSLLNIHLPEGIEDIDNFAFSHNRCPTLRIPPNFTDITKQFIGNCRTMFSIELSENITNVEEFALYESHSLRNIAFPPDAEVEEIALMMCTDIKQLYDTDEQLINALKHRFDNLPIHKMIYYQSYKNVTVDQLNEATSIRISQRRSKINPSGKQQDCLGMTPLHILACATDHNVELYKVLVAKYPENLIVKDRWGALPLLYAVWGDAPNEIVQLLIESYQSVYPNHQLNWSQMMETLCLSNVTTSNIRNLLDIIQQDWFPNQVIHWYSITEKAVEGDVSPDIFSFLVKCSFSKRVDSVGIKQWRDVVTADIERNEQIESGIDGTNVYVDTTKRKDWFNKFNSKLGCIETEYQILKEVTSMLELALWKNTLNESHGSVRRNKRMKIEVSDLREQCRFSCGADVVILNVLPFLVQNQPIIENVFDTYDTDDSSINSDY